MADGVDDDLLAPNLVEDEKRVGRCGQPPDIRIVGSEADLGMGQQQANHVLDTLLDACRCRRRRS